MDEVAPGGQGEAYYGGDHSGEDWLEFSAALPTIASAIKAHGDGSGGRIALDVPEIDKAALAWAMLRCPGRRLKVRITVEEDGHDH